jgi:hypothetical protein
MVAGFGIIARGKMLSADKIRTECVAFSPSARCEHAHASICERAVTLHADQGVVNYVDTKGGIML